MPAKKYLITAPCNNSLFWRPLGRGYTSDLSDAGIFSEEKAKSIVSNNRGDNMVLIDEDMVIQMRKLLDDYIQRSHRLGKMLESYRAGEMVNPEGHV